MKKPDDGKLRFITIIPTYALYFQDQFFLASSLLNRPNPGHNILEQVLGLDPQDIHLGGIHNVHFVHGSFLHISLNSIYN